MNAPIDASGRISDGYRFIQHCAHGVLCGLKDGRVPGTYYIKPNQPGLGSHVCNCGYVVSPEAQGQGVAAAMCEHSQVVA
ncbi:MAG: GNAT family N-acetyltransferase [Desulfobacterales bacterium]